MVRLGFTRAGKLLQIILEKGHGTGYFSLAWLPSVAHFKGQADPGIIIHGKREQSLRESRSLLMYE